MKNTINSIIIFIISTTIYGQDFDYLKKLDTIYIVYHGKKNEKKYDIQTRITPTNFKEKSFAFSLDHIHLSFDHAEFKDWEKKEANIQSERRIINKVFLKKIKDKIVSPDLINQYNNDEINCGILTQNKVFYILDYTEKKRKTVLYEVNYIGYCPGIE